LVWSSRAATESNEKVGSLNRSVCCGSCSAANELKLEGEGSEATGSGAEVDKG
jgi:hypothetical protein